MESCPPAKANPQSQPGRQKGSFSLILVHCEWPGRETEGPNVLLSCFPVVLLREMSGFKWGLLRSKVGGDPTALPSHLCSQSLRRRVHCRESTSHPTAPSRGSRSSCHQKTGLSVPRLHCRSLASCPCALGFYLSEQPPWSWLCGLSWWPVEMAHPRSVLGDCPT